MKKVLNPYIAGVPVTESSMFFGRQDVFDWIERSLAGKYVDHILIIHGQRRVGKTSVLKQIPNHLSNRYIQVYFDLQGRTQATIDRFLWWMARHILRTMRSQSGVTISIPDQETFTQDSEYFHTRFLPALKPFMGNRVLLLTFDEFDILSQPNMMESLGKPLAGYLSQLFELEDLNFIFSIGSSGKKLENMQASYTEFFKVALYKEISFLEQADCYQLITRPVKGVLSYDPGAVERIYQITSGHPYYTQLTCHELFSNCQKTEENRITQRDVEAILPEVVERGTVNLKFVWDEASDLEKWCLACLAQEEHVMDCNDLTAILQDQKVRFSQSDLNATLLLLREKDILTVDNRFIVQLLRLWLQINRPLERVRQELVEINPIANRFIEIGDEYKDRGEEQEAIQNYQQALSIDSANLTAQVSIASIYLTEEKYPQAAEAYDRALEIDPEDIQARFGFCQAHMELGEAALASGDASDAIDHLLQVVNVNPDHSEVRQRLADILCRQAEEMLARGEEEEALKAFQAATQYTPDDEALNDRYDQISLMVKGKVLAELLEKASSEWKRQNWSQAISYLEEYLQFEPDAPEIRTRLEDLQRQHHLNRLAEIKSRAEGFEQDERWDEAITVWEEYLALEPDDQPEAEKTLQKAKRYKGLAEIYAQAEATMQAKEYSRAIGLYQDIISQVPSYKDTARLLAGAVRAEQRGRPVWLSPWVWAALIFVVLAVLTGVFRGELAAWFSSLADRPPPALGMITAPTQTTGVTIPTSTYSSPTPAATASQIQPVSTQVPTQTEMSDPSWMVDFVQPIQETIAPLPPDFQDDFSSDKDWVNQYGISVEKVGTLADGAYQLAAADQEIIQWLPWMANNYVLEFDFLPLEFSGENTTFSLLLSRKENGDHYRFEIDPENETYQITRYMTAGGETVLDQGTFPEPVSNSPANLKVFDLEDDLAFLYNDAPLASIRDGRGRFIGTDIGFALSAESGSGSVEIEDLKLWDLDPIEIASWVEEFAVPALNSIRNRPPDFEDDFSKAKSEWLLSGNLEFYEIIPLDNIVVDGAFRYNGETVPGHVVLYSTEIQALDFILEFDLWMDNFNTGDGSFGFRKLNTFGFTIIPHQNECRADGHEYPIKYLPSPCNRRSWTDRNQIILISLGDQFGIYLNGKPLGIFEDVPSAGLSNNFILGEWKSPIQIGLDNLKFWELEQP